MDRLFYLKDARFVIRPCSRGQTKAGGTIFIAPLLLPL